MTAEAQPTAYAKKAGELAQAAMQDIPARLFAYAEVAKKAQTELFDTVVRWRRKPSKKLLNAPRRQSRAAKKAA